MSRFSRASSKAMALPQLQQGGFSLLEVLVALLITTVGLLGFAALQTRALVAAEDTYVRTQAMSLAQELLERKRINGASALAAVTQPNVAAIEEAVTAAYTNNLSWTGAAPTQNCFGGSVVCTSNQMAQYDIREIRSLVSNNSVLPNGSMVVVESPASGMLNIYVAWGDDTAADCAASNGQSGGLARRSCVVLEGE